MAARLDKTSGARPEIKEEVMDNAYAGMSGSVGEFDRARSEHIAQLRQTARRLAADAGFGRRMPASSYAGPDVNKDGGPRYNQIQEKTPKFSGKADWEAFHAQFELLPRQQAGQRTVKHSS